MDEENKPNVETTGQASDDKKQKSGEKKPSSGAKDAAVKKVAKIAIKHLPVLLPIIGILLLIILIIGLIGFFVTMPGMFLENIKEAASSIWGSFLSVIDGQNVDHQIDEQEEIELAQRINAMGYDIVGSGFADVTEYNEKGAPTKLGTFPDGKNYLRSYLISSESTYALAQWSSVGTVIAAMNQFFRRRHDTRRIFRRYDKY